MEQGFNFFEQNANQHEELLSGNIAVISDDFQSDSGHDFSKTFIECDFNEEWELKLLINPESTTGSLQDNIVNRQMYKKLPDFMREGKRFRYISNPDINADPVVQLFFKLNELKKKGDELASALIAEFLSAPNEACVVVQVIGTPQGKEDKLGQVLLLPFANGKKNAPIATLINNMLNPKKIDDKTNVFDMLLSPTLYLSCTKEVYGDDKKEGRNFSPSSFSKNDGSPLIEVDGKLIQFTADDLNWSDKEITVKDKDGKDVIKKIKVASGFKDAKYHEGFMKLFEKLKNPDISIHNHFAYKAPNDPRNTPETETYIVENFEKMRKAVEAIKNAQSVDEVLKAIGSEANSKSSEGETISGAKAGDLLKSSTAGLLNNSALNGGSAQENPTQNPTTTATETASTPSVDAIDFSAELGN